MSENMLVASLAPIADRSPVSRNRADMVTEETPIRRINSPVIANPRSPRDRKES